MKKVVKKKVVKKSSVKVKVAPKKKPVVKKKAAAKKAPPKKKAAPAVVSLVPPMEAIVFDTETTGLIDNHTVKLEKQPHVIEFYGARTNLVTGEILEEVDELIRPPVEISEEITKITGITNQMVADRQAFSNHAAKIFSFLQSAKVVIAHNMSFDQEMIDIEAERLGQILRWQRLVCTVEQTVHLRGHRLSLSLLHQHLFDEPFAGAHRAKVDVAALIRCSVELHKRRVI